RIALVAATALGAGLLSVVSVPAANAAADNVCGNSSDGAAYVYSEDCGSINLLGSSGSGLTQTATLLATGAIAVYTNQNTATATVTGGRFTQVVHGYITGTSSTSAEGANSNYLGLIAVPNSGATSMVISFKDNAGTLTERITVTIASTSLYNKYSAADSSVLWGNGEDYSALTDASSSNSSKASGGILKGQISITDAYGNYLATGIITATASAGAVVVLDDETSKGTTNVDYMTAYDGDIEFNVQQADVDVPWNGTVTIAYNGTVVATKSGVLTGEVASVTMSSPKIGKKNSSNTDAARVAFADAAGNPVYPAADSKLSAVSSTLGTIVSGLTYAEAASSSSTGKITMTCTNGTMGAVKGLQMQYLNTSGTLVKSNTWDSGCADIPFTVEASWDRVSYVPGSIATLTLRFKDSRGNLANAYDAIGADLTVTGGPSATAITPIAAGDKPSGVTGVRTYQYVVGTTEGDFVAVVVPATVKTNNSSATNISLPYSVKSAVAGVSNADVLKAIVSLIASINKQIAALQKALLKKK
ncbi:MAG: hypothetical protein ACOYJ3_02870, partial [Candidatus Planktophila sp.]